MRRPGRRASSRSSAMRDLAVCRSLGAAGRTTIEHDLLRRGLCLDPYRFSIPAGELAGDSDYDAKMGFLVSWRLAFAGAVGRMATSSAWR